MVPATITRRRVIAVGLGSTLAVASGCSALPGSDTESELGRITVENGDDAPHTIHVAVQRGEDLVHGSTHDLEGTSAPADGADFGSIDGTVLDDANWNGESGDWTVYTRVDDRTSWTAHELSADDGTTCYAVRLAIEDDASVTSFTPDCGSWPPDSDG